MFYNNIVGYSFWETQQMLKSNTTSNTKITWTELQQAGILANEFFHLIKLKSVYGYLKGECSVNQVIALLFQVTNCCRLNQVGSDQIVSWQSTLKEWGTLTNFPFSFNFQLSNFLVNVSWRMLFSVYCMKPLGSFFGLSFTPDFSFEGQNPSVCLLQSDHADCIYLGYMLGAPYSHCG